MKEGSKMTWADPKMLELDVLPEALGHCSDGSSASNGAPAAACQVGSSPTATGVQSCHTGEVTSAVGTGHLCNSGGCAGPQADGCQTGSNPGVNCS
jgi:hypothetical protein